MKIITKIALFAMVLMSVNLFAQGHHKMIETLETELGLSAEQVAQIQAIMEANKPDFAKDCDKKDAQNCQQKQKQCKKGGKRGHGMRGHGGEMSEEMKAHREKIHAEIETVLTPTQVTGFREFTESRQEMMMEKHGKMNKCEKKKKHYRPMHHPKHAMILHAVVLMTFGAGLFYLGTIAN